MDLIFFRHMVENIFIILYTISCTLSVKNFNFILFRVKNFLEIICNNITKLFIELYEQ